MNYFLIVNLTEAFETKYWWELNIPAERRPTIIHLNKELAERELVRLKRKYPQDDFILFEGIAGMNRVCNDKGQVAFIMENNLKVANNI